MVLKILVVIRDLWAMPAGHQPVLRLRIPSVPVHSNITTLRFSTATDTSFGASFKWGELPCCISMLYILPLLWVENCFFSCVFLLRSPTPSHWSDPYQDAEFQLWKNFSSIGTSACCFPGCPWRWRAMLHMSFRSRIFSMPQRHHCFFHQGLSDTWIRSDLAQKSLRNLTITLNF